MCKSRVDSVRLCPPFYTRIMPCCLARVCGCICAYGCGQRASRIFHLRRLRIFYFFNVLFGRFFCHIFLFLRIRVGFYVWLCGRFSWHRIPLSAKL